MESKLKPDLPEFVRAKAQFRAAIRDRSCPRCKKADHDVSLIGATVVRVCLGCGKRTLLCAK